MDIYVVLDGPVLVGVSARQQGAELIRMEWADALAEEKHPEATEAVLHHSTYAEIYDRQQIVNTELRGAE